MVRFLLALILLVPSVLLTGWAGEESAVSEMSREEALRILNESNWSKLQTLTRVVSGVGSGEYGEKEIFSRYYVRILSAEPVRQAFRRIEQLVTDPKKDALPSERANPGDNRYLIIGVAFRSNQPDTEATVLNAFKTQTLETLKSRAYLSTAAFPQLQLVDYHPPSDLAVGAQFVFPRSVAGNPVIREGDASFAFELDLPGSREIPSLRVTFQVTDEVLAVGSEIQEASETAESITEFRLLRSAGGDSVDLGASRLAGEVNLFPSQNTGRALHGSAYLFHRNDNLDARNFFDPVGEPLPEFKRNQFGFSLSAELGPRLDLFGSFDGLRIIQGSTLVSNVPTPSMKAGDFSELLLLEDPVQLVDPFSGEPFPGNRIPPSRIHPVARNLLPLIPDPNRSEVVRNYVNSQPEVQDQNTLNLRGDYGLREGSQLSVQFQTSDEDGLEVHPFPTFGGREIERQYEASVNYTRTFGDSTVANFRVEFDRTEELDRSRDERPDGLLDSLGIDGVKVEGPEDEGYPAFELDGYPEFGDEGLPQNEVENRYRLEGGLTLGRGDHILTLSGGAGLRQLNDSRSNSLERGAFGFSGVYSGHAFADFLLGRADSASRAVGSARQDLRSRSFQLSVVDEWRMRDRLTVTLGLGYEYAEPFWSIRNNLSVFRPLLFEPTPDGGLVELGQNGTAASSRNSVVNPDWNNFAPRVALAYKPFGGGRFVVRASWSVSYDPIPSYLFENYMGRNYPYYYQQNSQASVDSTGLDIGAPFETDTPTELGVREITPDLRTPYDHGWNVALENQLSDNWTLEFSYRGRRTLKSSRVIPANVPLPGAGPIQARRPNTDYGQFALVAGDGNSLFYELQVDLTKRFADGFAFDATLEWRRRFSDRFSGGPSNPRNLQAEWAPSGEYDGKQFRLNFIYDLPFGAGRRLGEVPGVDILLGGWRLSGIAELSTGSVFGVRLPGDFNNDGVSYDRPDRISSGKLPSSQRSIDRWFDTSAFVEPAPFSFGNSGRNILVGPPYHNWDLSLIKEFTFASDHRFEIRFAFFNAFNHANFENPGTTFGTRTFGVITEAKRAREIEVALKYSF